MQRSQDIAHLYQGFGGQPEEYRELTRTREAEQAGARWPLISAVGALSVAEQIPPVQAGEAAEPSQQVWHVMRPAVQTVVPPAPIAPTESPAAVPSVLARSESWRDTPFASLPASQAPAPTPPQQPSWATPASVPVPVPPSWSSPAPVGGTAAPSPLMAAVAPPSALVAPASPAPAAFWGAPISPVGAPPVGPVETPSQAVSGGAFDRPSPLARLSQPAATPAPSLSGLQQVFARLLGTRGRS